MLADSGMFHVDLASAAVALAALIAWWLKYSRRQDRTAEMTEMLIKMHAQNAQRIDKHENECDVRRYQQDSIITELRESNQHLRTLAETHHDRLKRLEDVVDRRLPRRAMEG